MATTKAVPADTYRVRFTVKTLNRLPQPDSGRKYFYDSGQPNLALCITAAGAKTFYRCGRIGGRFVRLRLGPFPDLSIDQARTLARQATGDIAMGQDPHRQRLARRHEQTLEGLFDYWLEYAKGHGKRTWRADQWQFDKYLAGWHGRKLSTIARADVQAWHNRIGRRHGPYTANRALALVRAMFNRAPDIGWEGDNPTQGVTRFPEKSRDRFLQPAEVARFFAAIDAEPEASHRDFFKVALLTGARRGNVLSMRWQDIDLQRAVWRIPMTKAGDPLTLPLSPPAVEILRERRADVGQSQIFVFPAIGKRPSVTGHLDAPKGAWARIVAAAGLKGLRMHDLRRSLGSWQAAAGVPLQVIGRSLGHKNQATTAVYARLQLDPVRAAVDAAGVALLSAANGATNGKP